MTGMVNSPLRSRVPGLFVILLVGVVFGVLLESALHQRGGEWPGRITCALTALAAYVYATGKFQTRKS
jgi:hypothetical protein